MKSTLSSLWRKIDSYVYKNIDTLFPAVAISTTVGAVISTFKGAPLIIEKYKDFSYDNDMKKPKNWYIFVKNTWKIWAPSAIFLGLSIANTISWRNHNIKQRLGIIATYSASLDYCAKMFKSTVETVDKKTMKAIEEKTDAKLKESAKGHDIDKIRSMFPDDQCLCVDGFTGRLFLSNKNSIDAAVNRINSTINNDFSASLNDFYSEIGLDRIDPGDDLGWNAMQQMEIVYTTGYDQRTGVPYLKYSFYPDPDPEFDKYSR